MPNAELSTNKSIRLDKWLWAARFFKTRSIAKNAIDGGKVHVNGQRSKASKEITLDMVLTIRQGWDEKTIKIIGLSDQRRSGTLAQQLYEETEESINKRMQNAAQRKASGQAVMNSRSKPTSKERREIEKFKRRNLGDI